MEKGNKETTYEKLWNEEYKAHKYTIEKNLELKATINRLVQINDNLIKKLEVYAKDFQLSLDEIIRLKALNEFLERKLAEQNIKEEEQND
jgi:hypothetical protein